MTLGADRVRQARINRQKLDDAIRVFKEDINRNQREEINKRIVEKNRLRNYEILKNLNRKRFQSIQDKTLKAKSIEEKLARAEANRRLIIQKRVQKAKELAELPKEERPIFIVQTAVEPVYPPKYTQDQLQEMKESQARKMQRASEMRQKLLNMRISRAKDSYTRFGPSEQEKQSLKLFKQMQQELFASKFAKSQSSFFKKAVSFGVKLEERPISESTSDRSVFVQSDIEQEATLLKQKKHLKNVVSKKASIAFEIERQPAEPKRCKTARKQSVGWEMK